PWPRLLDFLPRRQGLLPAVFFGGGVATRHAALGAAMRTVRELGFCVGLHSAVINPRAFARLLAQSDWVGFDVKAPAEYVAAITGVDGSGAANWRSLECLLDSGVAYECRTTVHWRLFDSERLWRLATRLREMGVERFAVQLARPARQLDPQLLAK
ncbi:anaerobic ribonucleoside-triphosphate reductase activating protein, partial [Pseudomonas aeruginosa]